MRQRLHHNAFWELETLGSVALPDVIPLDRMKLSAQSLYLHLLRWAKRAGSQPFPAYTGDLLLDSGLSRETLAQARRELCDLGLIQAKEKSGERGVWLYELRNPVTGGPLPNRERVVFAEVSNGVALAFYRRLTPRGQSGIGGAFDCPCCKRTSTVQVNIDSDDDERHGTWSCRKCRRYGGFQAWYRAVHNCDRQTATRGVRAMLQALIAEEQTATAEHESAEDVVLP